jgi:hypothetical protein
VALPPTLAAGDRQTLEEWWEGRCFRQNCCWELLREWSGSWEDTGGEDNGSRRTGGRNQTL